VSLSLLIAAIASLASAATIYSQTNLVSDIPGLAAHADANLVNPWGVAMSSTGPIWVSNEGTDTATIYNTAGVPLPLVVNIPPPPGGTFAGPTGQVFNGGSGFEINPGQPARFLFATLSGAISGWNPGATNAVVKVDNSGTDLAYTGLAIGNNGSGDFLYAADFGTGKIDVFDSSFAPASLSGAFIDPTLPAGYSPFNIQNVGGSLFVMYALKDPDEPEEIPGAGLGYVSEFDTSGNFVRRLISNGPLNAPWGIALAPAGFGGFSGSLLIGNFGDGTIQAFDPVTGTHLGDLEDSPGHAIENEGLWGLTFGNGGQGGHSNVLYFTAGIDDEDHGLFGAIAAVPEPGTVGFVLAGLVAITLQGIRRKPTI
jgi:uncharacterized protein (TIGR03118 family)